VQFPYSPIQTNYILTIRNKINPTFGSMQNPSPSQFIIAGNRHHPFGMFTPDRQPCEPLIFEDQKCAKKFPQFFETSNF
jgi:hypothetical protein